MFLVINDFSAVDLAHADFYQTYKNAQTKDLGVIIELHISPFYLKIFR